MGPPGATDLLVASGGAIGAGIGCDVAGHGPPVMPVGRDGPLGRT